MNTNINKNVSVWRGDNTPPTDYHLWIKSDGNVFINSGTQFKDYKELSGIKDEITSNKNLSIKDATVTRSRDRIYINLNRYKGFPVSLQLDFATHDQAGIMSVPDKEVVDKANVVINEKPIVGGLQVKTLNNDVSINYNYIKEGSSKVLDKITLPVATQSTAGLLSKEDKIKLNLMEEDIQDINNVLYSQYTKVTITATPTIIEKGVNKNITLSWRSTFNDIAIIPDSTSVKQNGTEIYKDANAQHLVSISDTATFTVDIQYKGVTKTASTKVNAYYPKYYGYSTKTTLTSTDILAFTKQTISSSAAGSGSMNVSEGNYVWFCVPSTMTINKVTSSGFDVPMEAPINVVVSGKDTYKCYRSSNTFKAGTFTYQIS